MIRHMHSRYSTNIMVIFADSQSLWVTYDSCLSPTSPPHPLFPLPSYPSANCELSFGNAHPKPTTSHHLLQLSHHALRHEFFQNQTHNFHLVPEHFILMTTASGTLLQWIEIMLLFPQNPFYGFPSHSKWSPNSSLNLPGSLWSTPPPISLGLAPPLSTTHLS